MKKKNKSIEQKYREEKARIQHEQNMAKLKKYSEHHGGKALSRRDFLHVGIIPFAAYFVAPNILQLLSGQHALADTCASGSGGVGGLVPFINVNLAGGAAIASNWVPGDLANQPLASYNRLGLGTGAPTFTTFGGARFSQQSANSGLLAGILSQIDGTDVAEKTSVVGICTQSRDDFDGNPFSITGLVVKAGVKGEFFPPFGTVAVNAVNKGAGVRQAPAHGIVPPTPVIARSFEDIQGSLNVTGSLSSLSAERKKGLVDLIGRLSNRQVRNLAGLNGSVAAQKLMDCAGRKNSELIGNQEGIANQIDPRRNTNISAVWNINQNTSNNNRDVVQGGIVLNVLNGNAPAGAIDLGGYDYHGNGRGTTDQRDRDAGVLIGRILRSASVLQKPVFIHLTSDGSVGSADGTNFSSDRGEGGATCIIAYHPTARPATNGTQIGYFTSGQAASSDSSSSPVTDVTRAASAAFANWASMSKRTDLIGSVLPGGIFGDSQLNQVIKIG